MSHRGRAHRARVRDRYRLRLPDLGSSRRRRRLGRSVCSARRTTPHRSRSCAQWGSAAGSCSSAGGETPLAAVPRRGSRPALRVRRGSRTEPVPGTRLLGSRAEPARARAGTTRRGDPAEADFDERTVIEVVEQAHRQGIKVRLAPDTAELLVQRGEYVPGQGAPLFELRPPVLTGWDWAVERDSICSSARSC